MARNDTKQHETAASRQSQISKFRKAARDLGTDESEEAFDRALRKVASAPPAPMRKSETKGATKKASRRKH